MSTEVAVNGQTRRPHGAGPTGARVYIPVRLTRIVAACIAAVGMVSVSGCSAAQPRDTAVALNASPTASSTETNSDVPASPSAPPAAPSPSVSAVLADGRSASYIRSVDPKARTVTFDLIVLLKGADATKEWLKTHPHEPEGPPEGYLIINDDKQLRTLPLSAQVSVKVIDLNAADASAQKTIKLTALPAHLAGERDTPLPYWLTVQHGQVSLLEEEYLA